MIIKKIIIFLVFLFIISSTLITFDISNDQSLKKNSVKNQDSDYVVEPKNGNNDIYHSSYRSNAKIYSDIFLNVENETQIVEKVYGGIVPHHFLASDLIAKFFKKIESQSDMETVVLVGPNHFNVGFYGVLTSEAYWSTPFGDIEPDLGVIGALTEGGFVQIDEKPFQSEHSISTITPFIKKTFPDAKIVPIIIKNTVSYDVLEEIAKKIEEHDSDKVLMIASVDFSHFLPFEDSQIEDSRSIKEIQSFNLDRIYDLKVDSPSSIYVLLSYLKLKEAQKLIFSERSNSVLISDMSDNQETVGYFIGHFGK
ncbi:MAG: AmmeMemoRadiSam system protein B [Candidatus Pacebacteria bacterium]|nr:AmmeMemoRadiSam system protein B [Candidatus Paceibacterota bacterium]